MTLSDLVRWGDQLREPSLVSAETLADALSNGAPAGRWIHLRARSLRLARTAHSDMTEKEQVTTPCSGSARTGTPRAPSRAIRTGSTWLAWARTSPKHGSPTDRINEPSQTRRLRSAEGEDDRVVAIDRAGGNRRRARSFRVRRAAASPVRWLLDVSPCRTRAHAKGTPSVEQHTFLSSKQPQIDGSTAAPPARADSPERDLRHLTGC